MSTSTVRNRLPEEVIPVPGGYQAVCVLTALTPIHHGDRTRGNEMLFRRQRIIGPGGLVAVPELSPNMLRHRMVREPMMLHLIEATGLSGRLTMTMLDALLCGGSVRESGGRVDLAWHQRKRDLVPALAVLGGSLPDQVIGGELSVDPGMAVCDENRWRIAQKYPTFGADLPASLPTGESLIDRGEYFRGAGPSIEANAGLLSDDQRATPAPYPTPHAAEYALPGSAFATCVRINHRNDVEFGAVLHAVTRWRDAGGCVGGKRNIGSGSVSLAWSLPPDVDAEACVAKYLAHVKATATDAADFLLLAYKAVVDDAATKRGRKGGKAAKAPAGEDDGDGADPD